MTTHGANAVRRRLAYRPGGEADIELSWHAITHVGNRRETNQDSYITVPPVFAVADGMGGHAAGEVASAAVVRRLNELAGDLVVSEQDVLDLLTQAVDDIEVDAGDSELGAGTTVTGVIIGEQADTPVWQVFNIGDSRVYQYFKGALSQITVDHSVVQHLIDTGAITEEEAEVHPHANVITRAVGLGEAPQPDYTSLALIPGQRLLICSDGLTKELTEVGIQYFLSTQHSAEDAANMLVDQALNNAGRDNVTVVVIDVHAVGDVIDTGSLQSRGLDLATVAAEALAESDTHAAAETASLPEVFGDAEAIEAAVEAELAGADQASTTEPASVEAAEAPATEQTNEERPNLA